MSKALPSADLLLANVSFAPMEVEDLDWVAASECEIYAFPWSRTNFADSLAAGYSSWVLRYLDEPVGYAIVMQVVDEAHVLNVSIVPSMQGRGLGSLMLDKLYEVARSTGAKHMFLEVRASNEVAQALYRKWGFVLIGRRKDYYRSEDGREDAIVMRREL